MKRKLNRKQSKWCKEYEGSTTFEPLMDDYLEGNKTFVQCAKDSVQWFEDWSADAFLGIPEIPE